MRRSLYNALKPLFPLFYIYRHFIYREVCNKCSVTVQHPVLSLIFVLLYSPRSPFTFEVYLMGGAVVRLCYQLVIYIFACCTFKWMHTQRHFKAYFSPAPGEMR